MTVLGVETVINTIKLSGNHSGNVLVAGAVGSGKNVSYIRPNILLEQEKSLLIVDLHKEEFTYTHKEKLQQGYTVLEYDLSSKTIFEDFRNDLNSHESDKLAIYLNDSEAFSNEKTAKERGRLVQELFKYFLDDKIWNQSLHIILDGYEYSPLPDMTKFLAIARGHRIRFSIVLQEISELERSIVSNCHAILYTGGPSMQDAEFLSRLPEETLVSTANENFINKPYITKEEILRMERNEALLIVKGKKPRIINKLFVEDLTTQKKNDYWEVLTNQLLEVLHDYVVQETNVAASSNEALLKVKELLNTINSAEDLEKITSALESSSIIKIAWITCKPKEEHLIKSVIESAKTKVESMVM
ncbi:type IV secretory system conjugative DNA transfer family protein [Bacillus pseudomycoides]|uniref:type IV secretory system conjugative DNA transfer family protein n=1 Tax=Bacillus pseudomycoides TaxID=64104 RepID=UPI00115E81A6|nr:type IV secretory system conjugative DNA transfer family protein [Bacillus pseudomycoides]